MLFIVTNLLAYHGYSVHMHLLSIRANYTLSNGFTLYNSTFSTQLSIDSPLYPVSIFNGHDYFGPSRGRTSLVIMRRPITTVQTSEFTCDSIDISQLSWSTLIESISKHKSTCTLFTQTSQSPVLLIKDESVWFGRNKPGITNKTSNEMTPT